MYLHHNIYTTVRPTQRKRGLGSADKKGEKRKRKKKGKKEKIK